MEQTHAALVIVQIKEGDSEWTTDINAGLSTWLELSAQAYARKTKLCDTPTKYLKRDTPRSNSHATANGIQRYCLLTQPLCRPLTHMPSGQRSTPSRDRTDTPDTDPEVKNWKVTRATTAYVMRAIQSHAAQTEKDKWHSHGKEEEAKSCSSRPRISTGRMTSERLLRSPNSLRIPN